MLTYPFQVTESILHVEIVVLLCTIVKILEIMYKSMVLLLIPKNLFGVWRSLLILLWLYFSVHHNFERKQKYTCKHVCLPKMTHMVKCSKLPEKS